MLADSFDKKPKIMMPYNFEYYLEHMEKIGLKKAKDLLAFERKSLTPIPERILKIIDRIEKRTEVSLREMNFKNFESELEIVRNIYNKSWAKNWGFVPFGKEEFLESSKELKFIANPKFTSIVEINGEPVGFSITIPDMNVVLEKLRGKINLLNIFPAIFSYFKIKQSRLAMLGVLPEYRKRGLDLLLIKHIILASRNLKYDGGELSWILEDNKNMINIMKEVGCYQTKTYRIFEYTIEDQAPVYGVNLF